MKKMSIVVGLTVVFLLLASLSSAEEYTVKRGDCLSKIGKQSGVAWRQIAKANNIKAPYVIYAGQKLTIPRSEVTKPVVAQAAAAADSSYLAEIKSLQAQVCELERKLKEAAEVPIKKEAPTTVLVEKKEVAQAGGVQVTSQTKVVGTEAEQEKVVAPSIAAAKEETTAKAEALIATNTETHKSYASNDQFDMYMSVGGWKSTGNKNEATGGYGQAKIRYRPFTFNLFEYEVGAGGFLMGESGSGATGKWDFRWNKFAVGPSFKVYGDHWDASTDLGWARQWDFGVNDKQMTDSGYLMQYVNIEQRRGAGQKWFPQTELMFMATIPFKASKESTKGGKTFGQSLSADNKSVYSIDARQSIYDFDLGNHMRLTPGAILGGGYEANNPYGKIGPFVKLAAYGQDIVTADISVKDKSSVDGVRWYGALMLHVGGAIKAVKAARITQPTAADLQVK